MKKTAKKLKKIKDQVIVITGASSGIGLATALMAAKKGAKVVLSSRNADALNKIVKDIQASGGQAVSVTADVSVASEMQMLKERALAEYGRIDTWVNNAGVGIFGEILQTPIEEAQKMFETNFWGIHYGCVEAIDAMKEEGGSIINLGSEVSERSVPLQAFYSASKHAIKGYTEGLRSEIEAKGYPIYFTLIRPAAIDTPFAEHAANRLEDGEPSLPPPVYHPDVVAKAILNAAETGKRDVYAGGASKMAAVVEHLAPGLLDTLIKGQMKELKKGTKNPHTKANEAVMSHPRFEGEVQGGHKGHVMKSSAWTSASQHPVVATAAMVGVGALAYAIFTKRAPIADFVQAAAKELRKGGGRAVQEVAGLMP